MAVNDIFWTVQGIRHFTMSTNSSCYLFRAARSSRFGGGPACLELDLELELGQDPRYSQTRALRKPHIKKPGPNFARIALRNGDPLAPRSGEI